MRRKTSIILTIIFLISFLFTSHSLALDISIPKASNEFYIYDGEGIIEKSVADYIISVNKELYEKTGTQIVIVSSEVKDNTHINEYATAIFEDWEIGTREQDNGVLILIDPINNDIWIEVGYGLEGALPDSRVKRIIENDMIPNFKVGDYGLGILEGFNSILIRVEDEYGIDIGIDSGIVIDGYGAVKYDENYNQYVQDNYSTEKVPQSNSQNQQGNRLKNILLIIMLAAFIMFDFYFLGGQITYLILRVLVSSGRGGGGGSNGSSGGGGRSGGGGAGGSW